MDWHFISFLFTFYLFFFNTLIFIEFPRQSNFEIHLLTYDYFWKLVWATIHHSWKWIAKRDTMQRKLRAFSQGFQMYSPGEIHWISFVTHTDVDKSINWAPWLHAPKLDKTISKLLLNSAWWSQWHTMTGLHGDTIVLILVILIIIIIIKIM